MSSFALLPLRANLFVCFFRNPTKIHTEGANRIHVSENNLWDNFCSSQGTRVKGNIFPRGLRKRGSKHQILARSLFVHKLITKTRAESTGIINGWKLPLLQNFVTFLP